MTVDKKTIMAGAGFVGLLAVAYMATRAGGSDDPIPTFGSAGGGGAPVVSDDGRTYNIAFPDVDIPEMPMYTLAEVQGGQPAPPPPPAPPDDGGGTKKSDTIKGLDAPGTDGGAYIYADPSGMRTISAAAAAKTDPVSTAAYSAVASTWGTGVQDLTGGASSGSKKSDSAVSADRGVLSNAISSISRDIGSIFGW